MEENKVTIFVFLIEEERRAEAETWFPSVEAQLETGARWAEEAQHEAEARRTRASETAQQEVAVGRAEGSKSVQQDELFVLDYQGERDELEGADETI